MIGPNFTNDKGWQLSINRLKAELGYKEWPDEGLGVQTLGNHGFYVLPAKLVQGRRKHRATVICCACHAHVSYGRLGQHLKVHK